MNVNRMKNQRSLPFMILSSPPQRQACNQFLRYPSRDSLSMCYIRQGVWVYGHIYSSFPIGTNRSIPNTLICFAPCFLLFFFFLTSGIWKGKREKPWGPVNQIHFSFGKFSNSDKSHSLT